MPPITNTKLPGRQTNNSLSSLTGNILISASTTTTNNTNEPPPPQSQQHHHQQAQASRKKKVKSSEIFSPIVIPTLSFTETEEVLQIGMHKVLEYVKNHKDAWPFMDPVEEDIAPRYYSIIRRPMDLLKMEEKLDNAEYLTFSEFRNDFKLIVNNCRLYNGQNNGNEYTEMVNNLQEAFQKSTKKYFEQHSSDEEINLEYPDIKTNVFREKQLKTKSLLPKPILTKQIDNDKNKLNKEKKSSIVNNVNNNNNNINNSNNNDTSHNNNSNKKNISKSKLQASSSTKTVPSSKTITTYKNADSDEADEESAIDEDEDDDDYVSDKKLTITKTASPPILKGIKRKKKEKEKVASSKKKKLKTNKNEKNDAKDEKIISKVVRSEKNDSDLDEIDDIFDEKKNLLNEKKYKAKRGKKNNKKEVVQKIEKSVKISKKGKQKEEEVLKEDLKKKPVKESKKNSVVEKVAPVSPAKNTMPTAKQVISTTSSSKKDKTIKQTKIVQSTNKKVVSKKRKHDDDGDCDDEHNDIENKNNVAMDEVDNIVAKKKINIDKEITSDVDDTTANLNDFSSDGSLYDFPIKDKKILKQKKYKKLKKPKLNINNNKSKINKKLLKSNINSNSNMINDKKILDKKLYKKKYENNTDDIINDDKNDDVIDNNNKVLNQSASIHNNNNNNNTKINNNKLIKAKLNDKNNKKKCLNNKSNLIISNNNNVNDNEDDLLSISSCNFSNSNSPMPTTTNYTSDNDTNNSLIGENDDLETSLITNNNNNNINDKKTNINHKTKKTSSIISSDTNEIKDKFDLIKERRNRTIDLENNKKGKKSKHSAKHELVKDNKMTTITTAAQSTTTTPTGSSTVTAAGASSATTTKVTNKNLKLNETIEKLKMKNKKSKEGSVLIDEIFGVKPSNKYHDEKTVFNKLREQCVDTTKNANTNNNNNNKKVNNCEYDFIDNDNNDNKNSSNNNNSSLNKKVNNKKLVNSNNNSKSVKNNKPSMPLTKNKVNNKTNIEALELETQQTLKDINKWLEHTPRYSQFSSTSNSPTRYYDDIDNISTTKLDTNDFSKCLATSSAITSNKGKLPVLSSQSNDEKNKDIKQIITTSTSQAGATTQASSLSASNAVQTTTAPITTAATTTTITTSSQAIASSTITSTQKKEPKERKKSKLNKEKLATIIPNRKRDPQRTIDRLQPGKTKGNLINSIQNINKPDDLHLLGSTINKIKEIKNSLLVKTDETGPKLSLGTVLNTEGFGIVQQHNFTDEEDIKDDTLETSDIIKSDADESINEEIDKEKDDITKVEEEKTKVETKKAPEKPSAAPDLSAWYGAFGGPKSSQKQKIKETDDKIAIPDSTTTDVVSSTTSNIDSKINESCSPPSTPTPIMPKSPQSSSNLENSILYPIPRQRKASTGSTVSEQSSFSQDPDSPRIGIDERLGSFPAPYPSPLGASPILVSPKADEIAKTTPPYTLNGAIKVGFYQDTTSKSSPEKSCSPKEPLPSPYPQYSSHVYSAATSATNAYTNYATFNTPDNQQQTQQQNKNVQFGKSSADVLSPAQPYYETYKQPNSQEPEYNTATMSPNTNSNSPYQQTSPYHQPQNSPYQSSQASHPPGFTQQQQQTVQASQQQPQVQSTQQQQSAVKSVPVVEKIPQGPNSPYQQPNSPFQQQNSPYQKTESSYQQQTSPFHEQQQQQQKAIQTPIVNPQHQSPNPPFSPSNHSSPYSQHDPNSPYSQQGPISPYQPNKLSPKQTQQPQQQQPNVQNSVSQNSLHDWSNQQMQQQETAAELHYRKVQQQTRMDQQHGINPMITPAQQVNNMLPNLMPAHLASTNKQTITPQLPYDNGMYPQSLTNCAISSSMYDASKKSDEQQKQHQQQNLQASHLTRTQNLYAPSNDINDGNRILDLDMISGRQQSRNMSNINNSENSMKLNDKPHQNNDMVNMSYGQSIINAANKGHADESSEVDAANYRFTQAAQKQHTQQQQKMDANYQSANTEDKSNADNTNSFNKQQMFDNIFNSMSVYGKPPPGFDISSSKAFEMYNRAATFVSSGFPTTVTSSASSATANLNKKELLNTNYGKGVLQHDLNSKNNVIPQQQQQHLAYQMQNQSSVPTNLRVNQSLVNDKQLNMGAGYNQQQSQQQQATNLNKATPSYHNLQPINKSNMEQQLNPMSNEHDKHSHINFNLQHNKHLLNQQHSSANDLVIPSPFKTGTENLGGPQSSNQHKLTDLNATNMQRFDIATRAPTQNQQLNMDLSGYKPPTFNTPTTTPMIDPGLRNLASLSMMDRYSSNEGILGFQGSTSAGYYDKSMPPAAHMFGKNLQQGNTTAGIQQMFGNPMAYNTGREDQQMLNYQTNRSTMQDSHLQAQQKSANLSGSGIQQQAPVPEVVKPKKGRRKKNATPTTAPVPPVAQDVASNQHLLQQQQGQQQQQQQQQHQQQQQQQQHLQGFQSYAGLKNIATSSTPTSADLKAAGVVPGSAFNFGPTPPIGLASGIYGENAGYLDEYRNTTNSYYLSATPHRGTPDPSNNDKTANAPTATPASFHHQFLSHSNPRTTYPFMNPQLDPNSPLYQQYIQRHQEELRTQMIINQGLMSGPPGSYPQTTSYHPALGMHKPYDAMNSMNRNSWYH